VQLDGEGPCGPRCIIRLYKTKQLLVIERMLHAFLLIAGKAKQCEATRRLRDNSVRAQRPSWSNRGALPDGNVDIVHGDKEASYHQVEKEEVQQVGRCGPSTTQTRSD